MSQQKQQLDPKDQILNISKKKTSGQFIFLSKIFLNKFGSVHLHGLGEATKTVAAVAETLSRKGYVTITKIETQTYQPDNQKKGGKRVKLIAELAVTEQGKEMIKADLDRKKNPEQQQNQEQPQQE